MTNPKMEKAKNDIIKAKRMITEYQRKLRNLERHIIDLENEEIIALYRKENLNDDDFSKLAALLRSQRENESADETAVEKKEEKTNALY